MEDIELFKQKVASVVETVDYVVADEDSPLVQEFLATRQTIIDGYNWLDQSPDQLNYLTGQSTKVHDKLRPLVVLFAMSLYDKLSKRHLLGLLPYIPTTTSFGRLLFAIVKCVETLREARLNGSDEVVDEGLLERQLADEVIDAIDQADYDRSFRNVKSLVDKANQIIKPVALQEYSQKYTLPYVGNPFSIIDYADDQVKGV